MTHPPILARHRLDEVRRAWESRDPELAWLVGELAGQADDAADSPPPREGAPTFAKFLAGIRNPAFARKPRDEQKHDRIEQIKALESPTAEVPLSDRLRLHEVIQAVWEDNGPFARSCLLEIIARVPLRYGPWRALKRIFKEAEARDDIEIWGALAARIDMERNSEITDRTLAYLCRRAWRYLRRIAQTRPACYADTAAAVLACYEELPRSAPWVRTHILYHEAGTYNRSTFRFQRPPSGVTDRAFAELWKRSPRPLFSLLERARSDLVRQFAADCLKADFRASLREVEPGWVARLVVVGSEPVDEFVVWVLNNVPRFEQAAFRTLGLHEAVLRLLYSPSGPAQVYAADYARTHARDLPVAELIRLADSDQIAVCRLATDLLQARDPRTEVGLDAWGRLLETEHGRELAQAVLRKHFSTRELTPEWFRARMFVRSPEALEFVQKLLLQTHPAESLGAGYFIGLIEAADLPENTTANDVKTFAMEQLIRFDVSTLDRDVLRGLMLRPSTAREIRGWIETGWLKAQVLRLDFLKALSFHPNWETDPWLVALRRDGPPWARGRNFDEDLADQVLGWLGDVRRFAPAELGFEWLLRLAARGEPRYHNFAVTTMIKGFTPADFALSEPAPPAAAAGAPATPAVSAVDLGGASFLFTGKLATMQRKQAEDQVRGAGGAVASSVTAKLHYLVIGDEGSPLYGHGKKGAKQLKAEELNTSGANIRIISETAFLKLLSGRAPQAPQGDSLAGAERLWEMANAAGPADAPLARFAIKYILRHHPDIALAETDRPVDPGAEIPAGFLSFERVKPLFAETRKPLRDLALELARWEFARWSPPADELVLLAESPHPDVRRFVALALLADDAPEHRRYRLDPESLTPAAVFRFCESADESTRALGMRLIDRSARFRKPEELFRLTESPDRRVRALVIRTLWSLYRDRGITDGWKPSVPPASTVGAAAKKAAVLSQAGRGPGPPARPEHWPSSLRDLWSFLRRTLFELPPPRPEKRGGEAEAEPGSARDGAVARLRPLPARRAKLALIDTMRDLALEDLDFARGILPLLDEFVISRGASERAACLVAVTRIRHIHAVLRLEGGGPPP